MGGCRALPHGHRARSTAARSSETHARVRRHPIVGACSARPGAAGQPAAEARAWWRSPTRVIADYRREEPTMARRSGGRRSRRCNGRSSCRRATGPAGQAADLRRARYPIRRAEQRRGSEASRQAYGARSRSFAPRPNLDEQSFDPYLGISRIAVYGLGDVDQAAAAIQEAEKRGYARAAASARCSATATCGAPTAAGDARGRSSRRSAPARAREGARRLPGLHRRASIRSSAFGYAAEEPRNLQGPARTRIDAPSSTPTTRKVEGL